MISPTYSASAVVSDGVDLEPVHQVPHDLGRARSLGDDEVDGPEPGVVVVVVDVEDVGAGPLEGLGRVAIEAAAVEEHDRALVEVRRRRADQPVEREEPVLVRQRELAGIDEHHALLAERGEDLLHRDQRPEGVAVGVLVRDDDQLLGSAQLLEQVGAGRTISVLSHLSLPRD